MAYPTLRIAALTAALVMGGAMAAQAAPDDEIKYRDGKPVGQSETKMEKAGGAAAAQGAPDDQIQYRDGKPVAGAATRSGGAMSGEPAKPSMKRASVKKASVKKVSSRKAGMTKRKSSAKRLRGQSASSSARM